MLICGRTKTVEWIGKRDDIPKGSFGYVYPGHYIKGTKMKVAVKVPLNMKKANQAEFEREVNVMKMIPHHVNIVKFIDVEKEENDEASVVEDSVEEGISIKKDVIIMEFCSEGSLQTVLDNTGNSNGLHDAEFAILLEHLAAGMQHLVSLNIVHRDIKPANILKHVNQDGSIVYKICDFGAAKVVEDGEESGSVHGTFDYMHGRMLQNHFRQPPTDVSTLGPISDLYAIGVTLYVAAANSKPFIPFGYGPNSDTPKDDLRWYRTMLKMIGDKPLDAISAVGTKRNSFTYSNKLPETCALSGDLQDVLVPLLAHLLDTNAMRQWNFNQFFAEVANIVGVHEEDGAESDQEPAEDMDISVQVEAEEIEEEMENETTEDVDENLESYHEELDHEASNLAENPNADEKIQTAAPTLFKISIRKRREIARIIKDKIAKNATKLEGEKQSNKSIINDTVRLLLKNGFTRKELKITKHGLQGGQPVIPVKTEMMHDLDKKKVMEEACALLMGLGGRKTQREKEIRRFGGFSMTTYLQNCKRFK